ncbi:hypothetical protein GCM10010123_22550 [Pilimelia anulata]|uniref:Uncharacterized protein n=1 Tax=Pilimelia anulata TaxID=53371 RepID=A0A8J3BBE1_9ACTN|nr:hypothetical protein GCM10010123_22550 [Pilimelia anulata]
MPTSVLLAVLAAAGLLALAPALVRRYDATERLVAERALSTARVLDRHRRPRTVPGRRPINPPRWLMDTPDHPSGGSTPPPRRPRLSVVSRVTHRRRRLAPPARAIHRRRRVLLALVLLNLAETAGVLLVGPGFGVGLAGTLVALLLYLVHLRNRTLRERRRRRLLAREAQWLAARQAEVRREQDRRAAERRAAARLAAAQREAMRRSLLGVEAPELPAAVGETVSYRRREADRGVRGRAYRAGGPGGRLG